MPNASGGPGGLEFDVDRWLHLLKNLLIFTLVCHVVFQFIEHTWRIPVLGLIARMFHPGIEGSAATWLSSAFLAVGAVGGWLIARSSTENRRWWYTIAIVLCLMSVDEVAVGHEAFSEPLRTTFDLPAFLYFAWVIPAVVVLAVGLIVAIPFIRSMDHWIRNRLILGGAIFVFGSIGMELPGAALGSEEMTLNNSVAYTVFVTLEEAFEMIGSLIAATALVRRGAAVAGRIDLTTQVKAPVNSA